MRASRLTLGGIVVAGALVLAGSAHGFTIPTGGSTPGISPALTGNSYAEVGDAGNVSSPQDIVGTDISLITGDIGSITGGGFIPLPTALPSDITIDTFDAFKFYFSGGDIEFRGVLHVPVFTCEPPNCIIGPGPTAATLDVPLPLSLFSASNPGAALAPTTATTPSWDIEFDSLSAGNYIIQATFGGFDPPYDITIITDGVVGAAAAVPEPATLALLSLGLAGLGFSRRKQ